MSVWKIYKLGEIVDVLGDGIHGTPIYNEAGDYYFINGNNLGEGYIKIKENTLKVDEKEYLKHKKNLTNRTLLLSINGTLGNVAKYRGEPCVLGKSACYLNISESCERDFIYYIMISPLFRRDLENMATGTTIKNVSLKALRNYEISLPPLAEQKRIADILSAIDDKIELNRRINANLEQQAQALYKSWFVDADTTGWDTKKLADFFNVITGKKDANYSTKDGVYPFFTCSQDILKAPNYSFEGAAILLAGNGDFNVKRYIGKFEAYQRTYVLIPFEKRYHSFLYLLIKYHLQEITGGSRGSVIKFITKGNIADFTFTMPPYSIDEKLSLFDSLFNEIDKNITEINNLSTIRDTLLPKLMSGEIKV